MRELVTVGLMTLAAITGSAITTGIMGLQIDVYKDAIACLLDPAKAKAAKEVRVDLEIYCIYSIKTGNK